jgi:hypothetical protein
MRHQNRVKEADMKLGFFLGLMGILIGSLPAPSVASVFHTPARRFGSAYSIKMTVWRDSFSYVVPVWIRPDRAKSSLDPGQLRFMGWPYPDLKADEVEISGMPIPIKSFRSERSDLAFSPEFAKNCCLGVIGQDVLEQYRLYFEPGPPARIRWERLPEPARGSALNVKQWESLFSVRSPKIRWKGEVWDLSRAPWSLDLSSESVRFDARAQVSPGEAPRDPLLTFDFIPGSRKLRVRGLKSSEVRDAAAFGLKPGAVVTELNDESVAALDRYEIDEILGGKKTGKIKITFLKDLLREESEKVVFDFKSHEFTQTRTVPTPARRNQNP